MEYRFYYNIKEKFIVSSDVIFLETNKNDKSIERQYDLMDNFSHLKTYYEFDNEIPHIEGGSRSWIGINL